MLERQLADVQQTLAELRTIEIAVVEHLRREGVPDDDIDSIGQSAAPQQD